jgi:hypothetical protein
MSKKRVSYQNLLKTAIAEFDTSKTVDVKGPMLDPILKWDGDGELPIYKDAASILERYYFDESADKGVEVAEMEYNEDGSEGKTKAEEHGEGTGTEQAGTGDAGNMAGRKKEAEKELAKEDEDISEKAHGKEAVKPKKYVDEQDDEMEDDKEEEEDMKESDDLSEDLENAVIEKLIAEMEEEEDEDEEEEVKEGEMNYKGDGVKPGMEASKEKKASGPEEDTQGAGTEQAGTGTDAGQVPDRKDNADKMVKPKNYNEQEEAPADDDGEEEEELDVDEKVKEAAGAGDGPIPPMKAKAKNDNKEGDEADAYEEAFQIFKEAIEEEEEEEEEKEDDKE